MGIHHATPFHRMIRRYPLLLLVKEGLEGTVCHVDVQLGHYFKGSVHGQHRNAYVHYVHIQVGHILGNRCV